jgi:hypothetical protein
MHDNDYRVFIAGSEPMKTMTAKPSARELEAKERESWEQFKHKD